MKILNTEIERERGFDFHEDLFQPFALKFDLSAIGKRHCFDAR